MKILLTGASGFVGCSLARSLVERAPGVEIIGLDNFIRPGSETNREALRQIGVKLFHGDVRAASDIDTLPAADWVVDASANPSVLAGIDGKSSSRQLVEHNLLGTVNLLEYCRRHDAGFVLLSTSRVFSIPPLASLPIESAAEAFRLKAGEPLPAGISARGISEDFSVAAPVSLYGATKLASEVLAQEYAETFGLPVWIDRCGVLAGAGQFGRPDQGIVAYWINAYLRREPLRYIGFNGLGHQARDVFHPRDLAELVVRQIEAGADHTRPRVATIGGGAGHVFSLANLTAWCRDRFGFAQQISSDPRPRPFDLPWVVMDGAAAEKNWGWRPTVSLPEILEEIAAHAEEHPGWLQLSAPLA